MISLRRVMLRMTLVFVFLSVFYVLMHPVKAETETIYTYDFESGQGDWYSDNGVWEIGVPQSGHNESHGGTQCAATVLSGDAITNTDNRLISPSITLSPVSGNEELWLQFWHWFSFCFSQGEKTQMSVYDSTSGIWSDWQTIGSTIMQSSGVWSYHGVDITGYAGKKVRVVFYYQGDGGPGWYIDDVEITGISTEPTPTPTPNPSPTPAITPTPTATPTPVPCKPENMTTDSKKMQITQGSSELVTITVTCEDGTPVAGETVKAKVEFKGKKGRSEDEGKGRGFRIRMKEK